MEAAVQPVVTWMVNGSAVDTTSDRISTEGDTLTFSPLATSDTGRYTCELTVAEHLRYVTVEAPVQSEEKNVAVQSTSYMQYVLYINCMCMCIPSQSPYLLWLSLQAALLLCMLVLVSHSHVL